MSQPTLDHIAGGYQRQTARIGLECVSKCYSNSYGDFHRGNRSESSHTLPNVDFSLQNLDFALIFPVTRTTRHSPQMENESEIKVLEADIKVWRRRSRSRPIPASVFSEMVARTHRNMNLIDSRSLATVTPELAIESVKNHLLQGANLPCDSAGSI